uniref:Uncharacterized protein n=1 Tax=Hucho hucho TaxID=62062 RepID=A0A4W5N1I6_9TELE
MKWLLFPSFIVFIGKITFLFFSLSSFQIQTRLHYLASNLQNKSNDIEVLAVDLPKGTLINFLSLEFDGDEQFNISVKHLLSRLPKQRYLKSICEEIHCFKILKRVAVMVLYSYKDDYYKILL